MGLGSPAGGTPSPSVYRIGPIFLAELSKKTNDRMERPMPKCMKRRIPPPFSSDSARRAQALSVKKRRATDDLLREDLAERLTAMPLRLRRQVVAALRIRAVERLRIAHMEAAP